MLSSTWLQRFIWSLVLMYLLYSPSAQALQIKKPTFSELTHKATHILRARVDTQKTYTHPSSQLPFTETLLRVQHIFKGVPIRFLRLRMLGGKKGPYQIKVPGIPRFKVGQEVVLFVRAGRKGQAILIALYYGVFDIRRTTKTEWIGHRGHVQPKMAYSQFVRLLHKELRTTQRSTHTAHSIRLSNQKYSKHRTHRTIKRSIPSPKKK